MLVKKEAQPARLSYFFGPGYSDVKKSIKLMWEKNAEDAEEYYEEYVASGLMSVNGLFNFSRALSIMTFGSIFSIIISIFIVVVLVLCIVPVYIMFSVVWFIDWLYLKIHKISVACSFCHSHYMSPIYECDCGRRHTDLTPGKYGIWKRKCECGRLLPTNCFNGRKNLTALCPECLKQGRVTYLNEKESRPFCIPVIGGRSVGKTAFITAFSKKFIDEVAPSKGMKVSFYDEKTKVMYQNFDSSYMQGNTVMTQKKDTRTNTSAIDFSFFVSHDKLKPTRLVHIYDIAGETFTKNEEYELPKHFTYSQGMIFMVDPFSIPEIRDNYKSLLGAEDAAGIGYADVNLILDAFIAKLRSVTGIKDTQTSDVPLAVVISKIDSPGLKEIFCEEKLNEIMSRPENKHMKNSDAADILCREFLSNNGAAGFINSLDMKFKKTKFFYVSAIGHERSKGAYEPKGVMQPIEWIGELTDKGFVEMWED